MLHELSMAHDRCVTATHCDTLRHTASHCITLHHTASHCIALQHTATHCNTLQHTDTGSMRKTYDGDLCTLGRLRLVGSSKLCVCFAEYSLFYRALLQKRPMEICVHKSPSVYMFHMWDMTHSYVRHDSFICEWYVICVHNKRRFVYTDLCMGWLWLVGSLKLQVSFARETYRRDDILQKRLIIESILLTVATPYTNGDLCTQTHLTVEKIVQDLSMDVVCLFCERAL